MSAAWALCREARSRAGLSQRELAIRAQVSPSTVARIERGRVEPTLHLLLRLVRACGLELRLHLGAQDPSTEVGRGLDFEARLAELYSLSAVTLEARRNVVT
ncbi:MAG: helix-turn-helix transcriptional regulator [Acidimicrobiales bacterium]